MKPCSDASCLERGVSSTMSSSWVIRHDEVVAFGGLFSFDSSAPSPVLLWMTVGLPYYIIYAAGHSGTAGEQTGQVPCNWTGSV